MANKNKKQVAVVEQQPEVKADQPAVLNQETRWNVLIYMAADNNLTEECVFSLSEILKAGILPEINIVAQLDSGDAITRFNFNRLMKGTNPATRMLDSIREEILSDPKALQNVSDAQMLGNFLDDKIGKAETQTYNMIILSGHGSGAVGDFLKADNPPSALSIPTLKLALESASDRAGRKIDILGMDSCLMSMVEVCYELRNQVDFLIGAEGFERNAGWPYFEILEALQRSLTAAPETMLEKLASDIVRTYVNYYFQYHISGVSTDMAAVDLRNKDNIEMLKTAISNLARTLRDNIINPKVKNAVLLAHWKAQSYKFEQYVDLWDFCTLLKHDLAVGIYGQNEENTDWDDLKSQIEDACRDVIAAVDKVITISCYSGVAFQHSHGLSIYFPWAKTDIDKDLEHYRKLSFAKATEWDEFLEVYAKETQREVRGQAEGKPLLTMTSRDDLEASIRVNPESGKGDRVKVARVKNPPTQFCKDDCVS